MPLSVQGAVLSNITPQAIQPVLNDSHDAATLFRVMGIIKMFFGVHGTYSRRKVAMPCLTLLGVLRKLPNMSSF
jgi:hypothetical protein